MSTHLPIQILSFLVLLPATQAVKYLGVPALQHFIARMPWLLQFFLAVVVADLAEPTKNKINSGYQQCSPRSQMSWGEIHTSQDVGSDNQIAYEIVCFHLDSPSGYSNRNRSSFQFLSVMFAWRHPACIVT